MIDRALINTVLFSFVFASVVVSARPQSSAESSQSPDSATARSAAQRVGDKQSVPRPRWIVKYDSGSTALSPGQWLMISFSAKAGLAGIATPLVTVPADALVRVEFSAKTEKAAELMQGPRSGCSYALKLIPDTSRAKPEIAVAAVVSLGSFSRFMESLNRKHSVRFVWTEEGQQRSLVVQVTDCEYQSFMANVRWLVGARWPEVSHDTGH